MGHNVYDIKVTSCKKLDFADKLKIVTVYVINIQYSNKSQNIKNDY